MLRVSLTVSLSHAIEMGLHHATRDVNERVESIRVVILRLPPIRQKPNLRLPFHLDETQRCNACFEIRSIQEGMV